MEGYQGAFVSVELGLQEYSVVLIELLTSLETFRRLQYLGCGESLQEFPTRGTTAMCRMYVCFYIRKGK